MTVLLDTGFVIALQNARDPHHARARQIATQVMDGAYGRPVVSDYIVAEILNYVSRRNWPVPRVRLLMADLLGISDEPWMDLVKVDAELFDATARLYSAFGVDKRLSFTDCSCVVLARALRTELIASFDSGFDGVLPRLS